MKRKWWIIAAATIAGCIGLALVIPALRPWRPGVAKENFDRIDIGMTRTEVEAILGPPTDAFPEIAGMKFDGAPDFLLAPIWESDRADEARIEFGQDNCVKTKAWVEWPDDRGVFDKLLDYLPWRDRPARRHPRFQIIE